MTEFPAKILLPTIFSTIIFKTVKIESLYQSEAEFALNRTTGEIRQSWFYLYHAN